MGTGFQLIFNPTPMSWIGAATWCEMKGGSLVTVDSQATVLVIQYYKDNDWKSEWSKHVWSGLYAFSNVTSYWEGFCQSVNFTHWAPSQIHNSSTSCVYMNSNDLLWHYENCSKKHYVTCQLQKGNCEFDDQNMKVDKAFTPLSSVTALTFDDCKTICDSYVDGNIQCWAIKYHESARACDMYVSEDPTEYFSTKSNSNQNVFFSTRSCYNSSIKIESEPENTLNISTLFDSCMLTTTEKTTRTETDHSSYSMVTDMSHTSTVTDTSNTSTVTGTSYKTQNDTVTSNITSETKLSHNFTSPITDNSEYLTKQTAISTSSDYVTDIFQTNNGVMTTGENVANACTFQCSCDFVIGNLTQEMLQRRLDELRSILTVDKTKTSSYIRRHTSAKDDRPSSKAIGSFGIILISLIVGLIVSIDVSSFVQSKNKKSRKRKSTIRHIYR